MNQYDRSAQLVNLKFVHRNVHANPLMVKCLENGETKIS